MDLIRHVLKLPDPRGDIPVLETRGFGLSQASLEEECCPKGPSCFLPMNKVLLNTVEKYDKDFMETNLSKGKFVKPPLKTHHHQSSFWGEISGS